MGHITEGRRKSTSASVAGGDTGSTTENERVLREMVREKHRLVRALRESEQRNEELRTRLSARETPARPPHSQVRSKGNKQTQPRPAPAPLRKGGDHPRQSVRYRLGDVLVNAVSRPGRDTLAAPVRLWRLLREGLRNRRARRARRRAAG